jgi:hypothetical protein
MFQKRQHYFYNATERKAINAIQRKTPFNSKPKNSRPVLLRPGLIRNRAGLLTKKKTNNQYFL